MVAAKDHLHAVILLDNLCDLKHSGVLKAHAAETHEIDVVFLYGSLYKLVGVFCDVQVGYLDIAEVIDVSRYGCDPEIWDSCDEIEVVLDIG